MSEIVHSKIQKWGNGLVLRVAGLIRDILKFEKDIAVVVEVFSDGLTVKKSAQNPLYSHIRKQNALLG